MQQRFPELYKYSPFAITAGFIFYTYTHLSNLKHDKEKLDSTDIVFLIACTAMLSFVYRIYKSRRLPSSIVNSQTFSELAEISEIPSQRLLILDNYAFDSQELATYAKHYPHRLGRNPHTKVLFSALAKNQIRAHPDTCNSMHLMEHQISLQNTLITDAILKRVIQLLKTIDECLNPPVMPAGEEERSDSDVSEEESSDEDNDSQWEADWQSETDEPVDPMALENCVDEDAKMFVPEGCNVAVIDFQIYLNNLKPSTRDTLNNYLIEIHSTRGEGEIQFLEFNAALVGGNNIEPCAKILQIYLWQFVVDFKPGMLKKIPDAVKQAATNAKLEIQNQYEIFKYPEPSRGNCCSRFFRGVQQNNSLRDLERAPVPRLGR
jgi:hypothetical protein